VKNALLPVRAAPLLLSKQVYTPKITGVWAAEREAVWHTVPPC